MIDYLPIVLTGIGIIVSILYYTSVLKNANKTQELQLKAQEQAVETRQAQIFMGIYNTWRSPQFRESFIKLNSREWSDFQDWQSKYQPIQNPEEGTYEATVFTFYDGVGVFVRRGLIDIDLVDELLSNSFISLWERFRDIIYSIREFNNSPRMYQNVEYLYNELMKLRPHQEQTY